MRVYTMRVTLTAGLLVAALTLGPAAMAGYGYPSGQTGSTGGMTGATATVQVAENPRLGPILVGAHGLTLYHFLTDVTGSSHCTGSCARLWPPFTVTAVPGAGAGVTGHLGTIKRADGALQVTYNGWPLYYYSGDRAAGDTNGQGLLHLWYVATPSLPALAAARSTTILWVGGGGVLLLMVAGLLVVRRRQARA